MSLNPPHPLDRPEVNVLGDRIPVVTPRKLANNEAVVMADVMQHHEGSYRSNPLRLAESDTANFSIREERPEHRIIAYMVSEGKSVKEIALLTGYSENWVRQIKRQPWFKERVVEILHEAGRDVVENFLQGEVLTSIETLVEIRDDADAKSATRVAAANAILDRALGKPTQYIKSETQSKAVGDVVQENERLERELASINEQLKQVGAN